ncbi:hypothetical protein PsYK624_060290 [Phanerochaete sordida]|uniref:MYND-type domain-containing protein n=1 Tax=Phanerochaete sordida TaxID=48140 RepID=A0A9P3G627_9APHY|nr:hypothetical protein PsYK624_060290 [Phanerochaete sordida]
MPVVEVPVAPLLIRAGPGSNLRDRTTFPPFARCPVAGRADGTYLGPDGQPLRHWCFVGEITRGELRPVGFELAVTDVEGREDVRVCYERGDGVDVRVDDMYGRGVSSIGDTLVVLYPYKDALDPDSNRLIVQDPTLIQVIPHKLEELLAFNDVFWSTSSKMCVAPDCVKSGSGLMQCSGCRAATYCSREHQTRHWPTHKRDCKVAAALSAFTGWDWTTYEAPGFRFSQNTSDSLQAILHSYSR